MRLKLAARKSDLARIQAYAVGEALAAAHPQLQVDYHFRESLGDINQSDPLWKMPERGVFTEDFYQGLVNGEWDLVVHSWKDLPVQEREGTEICATMARADARDMLLMPKAVAEKFRAGGGKLRILSSSPRRKYNLEKFLPRALPFPGVELEFLPVRGNIPTRVRKLFAGEGDALILAKAALDRLLSAEREEFAATRAELRSRIADAHWMVLPLSENPTAAAQGALAIEISRSRADVRSLLHPIQAADIFADVAEEREILAGHGGGCHQKIGVNILRGDFGRALSLRGETDKGERLNAFRVLNPRKMPPAKPAAIFPQADELSAFFERRDVVLPKQPEGPLIVARQDALPPSWKIPFAQIVWAAGVKTWEKLAARGVWVYGCFDGLGESDPGIVALAGEPVEFTKLSHSRGEAGFAAQMLATYELAERALVPDLSARTHFFWMSGSQFEAALKRFPAIARGVHACGPGHTAERLRKILGAEGKFFICLGYEAWKEELFR